MMPDEQSIWLNARPLPDTGQTLHFAQYPAADNYPGPIVDDVSIVRGPAPGVFDCQKIERLWNCLSPLHPYLLTLNLPQSATIAVPAVETYSLIIEEFRH